MVAHIVIFDQTMLRRKDGKTSRPSGNYSSRLSETARRGHAGP